MYGFIRKIHSYSGLLLVLFVLMYFLTGVLVTEQARFGNGVSVSSEARAPLTYEGPADDTDAMMRHFQDEFDLYGQRMPVDTDAEGVRRFRWNRPGAMITVAAPIGADSVTVVTEDRGVLRTAHVLHRTRGYGGGFAFDVWAVLYDLVSLAMIVFSLTGIYMWFRRTKDRRLGLAVLTLSWGFTIGVYAFLWFAP